MDFNTATVVFKFNFFGLRGNFELNGFTYVTPFPVIVCLGVNEVLFGHNVNDTTPLVFPGSTHTLFLTVSGTKIC